MVLEEASAALEDNVNVAKKKSVGRSSPSKKNGAKVPRKIHKAERERLKRDHMNVLFLELGKALEAANQNNGKSSTLSDTIRLLQDLVAQVDSLKKENATLLSKSQYVTVEKNELKDENSTLEAQIRKLQTQIEERVHSQSLWRLDASQLQSNTCTAQCLEDNLMLPVIDQSTQAASILRPIDDPKLHAKPDVAETVTKLPPNVSRPHARYPSPSTWPSHFLSEQPKVD